MTKAEKNKIVKQILMICEKQYRKGFQQGFEACKENKITQNKVDSFRHKGAKQNYSKVVNPIMGYSEVPIIRINAELMMDKMDELKDFINL